MTYATTVNTRKLAFTTDEAQAKAVLPLQRFSNVPVTYRGKCSLEDLWELCTRRRVEAYNSRWHASSEEAPALCIAAKLYTITDKQLLHLSGSNVVF